MFLVFCTDTGAQYNRSQPKLDIQRVAQFRIVDWRKFSLCPIIISVRFEIIHHNVSILQHFLHGGGAAYSSPITRRPSPQFFLVFRPSLS